MRQALAVLAVRLLVGAATVGAQTTTMPSTLRYGSGLLDVPVASVLPHLAVTGTYSGFFVRLDRTAQVDGSGNTIGYGPAAEDFRQDASFAMGLFDRAEIGTTLQSFGGVASGGDLWGLFGRLQLLKPSSQGVGLAAGARWVKAPDFGDGQPYRPTRLGFPDRRFRKYPGRAAIGTGLSLYGVATAHMRAGDGGLVPPHDFTFSLGYGTGMFQDGGDLPFYGADGSGGWFFGSAVHVGIGGASVVTLMGEYNGFDVNVGTLLDVGGIRLGVQYLGINHDAPPGGRDSEYGTPRLGVLASLAVCPRGSGLLCKPRLMIRPKREMVQLPAPPPDTVVVTRVMERPLPDGTPALVCLSTGENVRVLVSARGDTLVGPDRVPVRTLRPGVAFAGVYAEGAEWFRSGTALPFDGARYEKSGTGARIDCGDVERVGETSGVPLFARRGGERPFQVLWVPVRPGIWMEYRRGSSPRGVSRPERSGP